MANPDLKIDEHFFNPSTSLLYFEKLLKEICWKQKEIKIFGKAVLEPRLTAWHGNPGATYTYSGISMTPLPWSQALLEIKTKIEIFCGSTFNSVLLNLYRDQSDSMGMHSDDEKELGENPVIASVSFGATRKFVLKQRSSKKPALAYLLRSGSLLIMQGKTQHLWKHGVPKETKPCGARINLTFRKILVSER